MEDKATIVVRVEEFGESVALSFGDGEVPHVSEEVQELAGRHGIVAVTVQSLEGRVRGKVADGAESLACCLEATLAVANSNQQALES